MKIMIMTDMEGVAGILNFQDWVFPDGTYYDKGKRLLTEEVNAAVQGFFDGDAKEIVVVDGHGHGGIDPEILDERVQLSRGHEEKAWPWGLDKSFHGLAFVGQHAKAGTPYSHMTHTQCFDYVDLAVNGISIGEYGQLALCAMECGVPTILACGEEALAKEAEALTPGVITVAVKRGLLPDGLDDLDADAYGKAKLSAIHIAPKRARILIRDGARKAVMKLKEKPASFQYPKVKPPYVRTTRFRKTGDTPARSARCEQPDSIIALMNMP
ncbi:MAG: M55 family metallopeptidase [Planctomycetes bacterium]|nr:M55 family metallopeptidase [Planctomycetota bacterium]